jgi:hypothetical protein
MAVLATKAALEQYFIDNWAITSKIQFSGVEFDYSGLSKWISLKFIPVENDRYAMNGTVSGRINYSGLLQVFCYAKNESLAYGLSDDVKSFLHDKTIGTLDIGIGQDRGVENLDNGFSEALVVFEINNFT